MKFSNNFLPFRNENDLLIDINKWGTAKNEVIEVLIKTKNPQSHLKEEKELLKLSLLKIIM